MLIRLQRDELHPCRFDQESTTDFLAGKKKLLISPRAYYSRLPRIITYTKWVSQNSARALATKLGSDTTDLIKCLRVCRAAD